MMTVFWVAKPCSLAGIINVSERLVASIMVLVMVAVSTSETSVNFNQTTRCNIPEDSQLHSRRHENLKSHQIRVDLKMLPTAAVSFCP